MLKSEVKQLKDKNFAVKDLSFSNNTDEEEIEKLCGMDLFFKELNKNQEKSEDKGQKTELVFDTDEETNTMLSNFIENGTL